jgi:bifunctional non-homologous end joining protein LigD
VTSIRVGRRTVELSNPDKVLFSKHGITKRDLAEHYRTVAPAMIPFVRGRPVTMERHPDGVAGPRIIQQAIPGYFPSWIGRVRVPKAGGTIEHVLADDAATLVYLANQACITPHVWLSHVPAVDRPDQLMFDLDPPNDDFEAARRAAIEVRRVLDELDLPSFVKTTGGDGLHVTVPLRPVAAFDDVRSFARDAARLLELRFPDDLTTAPRKASRGGRLYLDMQRNAYGQTAVPPYAVRASPEATVAAPLDWSELDDGRLRPSRFTVRTIGRRLADDPWRGFRRRARSLTTARRSLAGLLEEAGDRTDRRTG